MAGRGSADARESQRRRRISRVLVAVLVGALLFEGGLRLVLGNFAQSRLLQRSADPEVCLELRPGADLTYTGWLMRVAPTRMRVNRLGARGDEIGPKVPGRLRVAAFGDSFTFGQGVEEDESWPAVLQAALRDQAVDVEVLNFGVPGHGTPQAVALAKRVAPIVQPDVVLIGVFTNDLSPADSYCTAGQGDSTAAKWVLQNVYAGRLAYILTRPLRGAPTRPEAARPEERFQASLTAIASAGTVAGYETAAVLLSDRASYAAEAWCDGCTPPHDLITEVPIGVLDMSATWPILTDYRDRYFLRGEEHLTVAGNRVLGQAVAQQFIVWRTE